MDRQDTVWQSGALVRTFLEGVRGGLPLAAEQIEVMLRVLAASDRPLRRFVDLGCGDGILAAAILERYPDAAATLVDFSEPMLAAARARFAGRAGQARFVQADFGDPGWVEAVAADAPFDAIVSGFAIHHQPDAGKRRLYGDVYDLLAPGGAFVNIEHVASATPWLADIFDNLLIDGLTAYQRRVGSEKTREAVATDYVHRPDKVANILAPVEDQLDWLRAGGFADVDCYFKLFEFAVFGGRRA